MRVDIVAVVFSSFAVDENMRYLLSRLKEKDRHKSQGAKAQNRIGSCCSLLRLVDLAVNNNIKVQKTEQRQQHDQDWLIIALQNRLFNARACTPRLDLG